MKRVSAAAAVGKTIKAIDFGLCSQSLILFTDDTYLCIEATEGYDRGDASIDEGEFDFFGYAHTSLIALGMITKEELDKEMIEAEDRRRKLVENGERNTLARLQRKYSGGDVK